MKPLHGETIGSGLPVLLIHGFYFNATVWDNLFMALGESFQVTRVNLPGYGVGAHHSPRTLSIEKTLTLLAAQLTVPTTIIGWSLGAKFAVQLAVQFPEKVSKLITLAYNPHFMAKDSWPGVSMGQYCRLRDCLSQDFSTFEKRFMSLMLLGDKNSPKDYMKKRRYGVAGDFSAFQRVLLDDFTYLQTADQRGLSVCQPHLNLLGEHDPLIPHAWCAMQPQVNRRDCIVADAGHGLFISHETTCLCIMYDFIAH